jgi:CRP/FNR family transcriptional regulator, cyclic AMP receptor protein
MGAMTRDERIEALRRVSLFASLDKKTLRSIADLLHERTFEPGWMIAEQGKEGIGFFVIEDGEAEVLVEGSTVRRLVPGDHFGEIALLGQGPRTASVRSVTAMRCLTLDGWHFRPLVKGNPELSWALLEALARQVVGTD